VSLLARLRKAAALLADPRVKKLPRFAVVAALAYLIWPADLVPDFLIPLAGYLDDATLLWLSTRWLFRSAPPDERGVPPQAAPR
jgi:uncharacterized membrane protein YkvA (DUF1232 family)